MQLACLSMFLCGLCLKTSPPALTVYSVPSIRVNLKRSDETTDDTVFRKGPEYVLIF